MTKNIIIFLLVAISVTAFYSEELNLKELIKSEETKYLEKMEQASEDRYNAQLTFKEAEIQLIGTSPKKAALLLGNPDVVETYFGHHSKGYRIWRSAVRTSDGTIKHLVIFYRKVEDRNSKHYIAEEMYAVGWRGKACFGIHCITL